MESRPSTRTSACSGGAGSALPFGAMAGKRPKRSASQASSGTAAVLPTRKAPPRAPAHWRSRKATIASRENGPRADEFERARAYAAGRRVLAFENTNAVARFAATHAIVFGEDIDPDRAIDALDAVTFDDVAEVAKGVDPDTAAVACVGPHEESEF